MPSPRLVMIAAVLAAVSCAQNDQDPATAQQTQAAMPPCNPPHCGRPTAAPLECTFFWRLNTHGLPNDQHARIDKVRRVDGRPMQLIAELDRLRGMDPRTNEILAESQGLVGTTITVVVNEASSRTIAIDRVTNREHFQVGAQSSIEAYDLSYVPLDSDRSATTTVRAIVFTGDDYDPFTKHVHPDDPDAGWMNFACLHSPLYELHTLGYTAAASIRLGIHTTIEERQAVLYARTATMCDLGMTWAPPAQPITLVESHSLLPPTSPYLAASASYESIWNANGAVCLDTPRMATSAAEREQIQDEIAAACGRRLPSCSAMLAQWPLWGTVLTGTPAQPP